MMNSSDVLRETLCLGVIQTTLDGRVAWADGPPIAEPEQTKAANEIDRAMVALGAESECPNIVLVPELSVPRSMKAKLKRHADNLEAIIIAGLDYRRHGDASKTVNNEAMMVLPRRWLGSRVRSPHPTWFIGKTYPAWEEERKLQSAGFAFERDPRVWVFDGGPIGNFAVAICFDFLDLERVTLYRGKVHHLFVLAYNRDVRSFSHVAEALARMLFCNVIVCNTGQWGGSFAVSPYREEPRRTVYRKEGAGLFSAQVIRLPVEALDRHQRMSRYGKEAEFKAQPPGFQRADSEQLLENQIVVWRSTK